MEAFEPTRTERIPLELPNDLTIQIEATVTGREDVAFDRKSFQELAESLEGIIDAISGTLHRTLPTKATVKFGVDVGIESGSLTAIIVKGSGKANLEITLEWQRLTPPVSAEPGSPVV